MGLAYQTTQWADSLWAHHVDVFRSAREMVHQGTEKQRDFPSFAQDVHSKLYLRHLPPAADTQPPSWATALHEAAEEIPEWQQLRTRCQAHGFSAGVATESLLTALLDQVPQHQQPTPDTTHGREQTPSSGGAEDDGDHGHPTAGQGQDPATIRRRFRQAIRHAEQTLTDAERAVDTLCEAVGVQAGTGAGTHETLQDVEAIRRAYEFCRHNPELQRIAELAGRLKRIASSEARRTVMPGVGSMKGITQGGDLSLLLPSEVVGLRGRGRRQRLQTLERIITRRALQYHQDAEMPAARGPIIVCCDESTSMRHRGRQTWSKAVAMALLMTATEQRRAWHMIGFESYVTHQETIVPGEASLDLVMAALCRSCEGGTDFDKPLHAALDALEVSPVLHKADVVFITDGEDAVSEDVVERYQHTKDTHGLGVYVIGVGADAKTHTLHAIATETYHVDQFTHAENVRVASVVNLPDSNRAVTA